MKFILRIAALGQYPEIPIAEETFNGLVTARQVLLNALALEEKYAIILRNHFALEKQCLDFSCEHMLDRHSSHEDFFEVRLGLNASLVNLLTSAGLYLDRFGSHLKSCTGLEGAKEIAAQITAEQYDKNPYYKFMTTLRNHVLHYALPVHVTHHHSHAVESSDGTWLEYGITVVAQKAKFAENPGFKKSVLKGMPEAIDLRLASRSYVESLSHIHKRGRDTVKVETAAARKLIHDQHLKYATGYKGPLVGLAAQRWDGETLDLSLSLNLDWDDVRARLAKTNGELVNLSKRYVIGRGKTNP
jgi:hypothetical protein